MTVTLSPSFDAASGGDGNLHAVQQYEVARIVLVFGCAAVLAIVGTLPRVRAWQERFSSNVLATTGFLFLVLGFLLSNIGVLSQKTVSDMQPVYEFGLGWIGFTVGMQLNLRRFDRMQPSLLSAVALVSVPPVIITAIACYLTLVAFGVFGGTGLLRDVFLLAACAAVSATANLRLLTGSEKSIAARLVTEITQIDQLLAFAILAFVAIRFRPAVAETLWRLPRSAWFLVMAGIGFISGALTYLLIRKVTDRAEELALLLGSMALAAGIAGYLALSVPVVCALAGAVLASLPLHRRVRIGATLRDVDRPIYLLMLFLIGASWRPDEWQGWVLGVVFALSRGYGKLLGSRLAVRLEPQLPPSGRLTISLLPESAIAIIVIFSIASMHGLNPPAEIRWAINAVIVGSLLTEGLVQLAQIRVAKREAAMVAE